VRGVFSKGKEFLIVNATAIRPFVVIAAGAAVTAAALAAAILQGPSESDPIAGPQMTTGVTVTATTPPSEVPIPEAQPSIKGPAPLPSEEQGVPG
jgi:hypothetical protein